MKQSATTKAALPDKLKLDGRFIQNGDIGWDGADTAEVLDKGERGEAFAAELVLRYNAHEQMREALLFYADHMTYIKLHGRDFSQQAIKALAQLERPA